MNPNLIPTSPGTKPYPAPDDGGVTLTHLFLLFLPSLRLGLPLRSPSAVFTVGCMQGTSPTE